MAFHTRRAYPSDASDIASAHLDSIRSLGTGFYLPEVVNDWAESVAPDLYINAMDGGEVFFIAVEAIEGANVVLGFASDYVREGSQHGTSVYVRGPAARRGVGSTLFKLAEAEAISRGATSFRVEVSFAGVEFYKANGFVETGRGETHLKSGRPISCVFMEKILPRQV